jgi:hypothetical protein
MMFSVPLYFQVTEGLSNTKAGSKLVVAILGNTIGGLLTGYIIKRYIQAFMFCSFFQYHSRLITQNWKIQAPHNLRRCQRTYILHPNNSPLGWLHQHVGITLHYTRRFRQWYLPNFGIHCADIQYTTYRHGGRDERFLSSGQHRRGVGYQRQ